MPKISILMTSYNHERYIKESLESILEQTYSDFELIIVDDCSTDSSFNIISSFDDPRITVIKNERNMGPEFAFDILHKTAKGEYIAIADSDNVWKKNKLEKQVAFLDSNPQYTAVFTRANIIDEKGEISKDKSNPYDNIFNVDNRSRYDWLRQFFYYGNCLCHPSILIKKEAYRECNMIVNSIWQLPDFYKWIRLCLKKEIYVLEDKLINFRVHSDNTSGANDIDALMRMNNEVYYTYSLFYELDKEGFLQVFKDNASEFIVQDQINTKFAVSKMLLDLPYLAAKSLGLNTLFEILNNDEESKLVYDLYGYDAVNYKEDETKNSPFISKDDYNSIFTAKLYFDFGSGFNETDTIEKTFMTNTTGKFGINFENIKCFCNERKILKLRFDPCTCMSKIMITSAKSNGDGDVEIIKEDLPKNQYEYKEGYDFFYTNDPYYIIDVSSGDIDKLSFSGNIIALSTEEAITIKNLAIDKKEKQILEVEEKLQLKDMDIVNHQEQINKLKEELNDIYNSSSWKITKPLRNVKKLISKN